MTEWYLLEEIKLVVFALHTGFKMVTDLHKLTCVNFLSTYAKQKNKSLSKPNIYIYIYIYIYMYVLVFIYN